MRWVMFFHFLTGLFAESGGVYLMYRRSNSPVADTIGAVALIVLGVSEVAWAMFLFVLWRLPFAAAALVLPHPFGIGGLGALR